LFEADEPFSEGIEAVVVAGAVFQQVAVIKDVAAFSGGEIGDEDGIGSDGGGAAIGGDASGALEDGAVLLGGEFNGVGASAGGDVDLQTTRDADLVGTITAIDSNRSKAITATTEVVLTRIARRDSDLVVAGSAIGGDINSTTGVVGSAADCQFVVAFSSIKESAYTF